MQNKLKNEEKWRNDKKQQEIIRNNIECRMHQS